MSKQQLVAFVAALWVAELAIIGAIIYLSAIGRDTIGLVILAIGFGLAMPFPHKLSE